MTLSIMTLSIMTLSIMGLIVTPSINDIMHNNALPLRRSVVMLSCAFYLLLCWMSLCWMLLCWMLLGWMLLGWKLLCWMSLGWMLLSWVLWRLQKESIHAVGLFSNLRLGFSTQWLGIFASFHLFPLFSRRHDILSNDIRQKDTQHKGLTCDTQALMTFSIMKLSVP